MVITVYFFQIIIIYVITCYYCVDGVTAECRANDCNRRQRLQAFAQAFCLSHVQDESQRTSSSEASQSLSSGHLPKNGNREPSHAKMFKCSMCLQIFLACQVLIICPLPCRQPLHQTAQAEWELPGHLFDRHILITGTAEEQQNKLDMAPPRKEV